MFGGHSGLLLDYWNIRGRIIGSMMRTPLSHVTDNICDVIHALDEG